MPDEPTPDQPKKKHKPGVHYTDEERLGMFIKVETFLRTSAAEFAANPAIEALRVQLKAAIAEWIQQQSTSTRDLRGFAEERQLVRGKLTGMLLKIRAALYAYFRANNDATHAAQVSYSETSVRTGSHNDVYVKARQAHELADPIKASLGPYMVSPADVDALKSTLDAFLPQLTLPEDERNKSTRATKDRNAVMHTTRKQLLPDLDDLLGVFRYTNKKLWDRWRTARKLDR